MKASFILVAVSAILLPAVASAANILDNASFELAPLLGAGQTGLGFDEGKLISTQVGDPRYSQGIFGVRHWANALQPEGWSDQGLTNRLVPGNVDGLQYAFINSWGFRFVQTTSHVLAAGDQIHASIMMGSREDFARAAELEIIAGDMDPLNVNQLGAGSVSMKRVIGGTSQWNNEAKDFILPGIGWQQVSLDFTVGNSSSLIGKPLTYSFKLRENSVGNVLFDAGFLEVRPVPEPGSLAVLFLGLGAFAKARRKVAKG